MPQIPYKIRVRRVRGKVIVDLLQQMGRSGWSVVETVDQGAATIRDALGDLNQADLTKAPRLKEVLFPIDRVDEPPIGG